MYAVNNSASVLRYANGRHAAVCRPFGDSHVCVRGDLSSPGSIDITAQRGALDVIDRIASNLELAASPTDLASWFDARRGLAVLSPTDQDQRRRPKAITATRPMMKITPSVVPSTPCPLAIRYTHATRNARVITTP